MEKPLNTKMRYPAASRFALILATLVFSACATVPITGRQQLILSSPSEEVQLGQALFDRLVSQATCRSKSWTATPSPEAAGLYSMVDKVLPRISKPASEYLVFAGSPWSYVILRSEVANAGDLPGNRLIFWEGIFRVAPDEPSLAVIVGHEVGHVIAQHGAERRAQSELLNLAGSVFAAAVAKGSPQAVNTAARLYGVTSQVGLALPFSRSHETEADKIGLILMAKAGYDPRQAITV